MAAATDKFLVDTFIQIRNVCTRNVWVCCIVAEIIEQRMATSLLSVGYDVSLFRVCIWRLLRLLSVTPEHLKCCIKVKSLTEQAE